MAVVEKCVVVAVARVVAAAELGIVPTHLVLVAVV